MRRALYAVLAAIALFADAAAIAADCRRTGSVCVDSTPCKTISGTTVCLAGVTPPSGGFNIAEGCWDTQDTYECIKPDAVNYCQPLVDSGCWQTGSVCEQTDTQFGTGCMKYTQTYRCGNASTPTPVNTIRLDDSYTLVSSDYDRTPCQSLDDAPHCSQASSTCIQASPSSPLPPGIDPASVAPDGCYQVKNDYACTGTTDASQCDSLATNPNCALKTSGCTDRLNGQCLFEERTYSCLSTPGKTETVTDCSGQSYCSDGKCFSTGNSPDTDFAKVAAMMEAMREAGTYLDPNSLRVFSGKDSRCSKKLFGLVNCCKTSSGGSAMSNAHLVKAAGSVAMEGLDVGSRYVFDALQGADSLQKGMGAMLGLPKQLGLGEANGAFDPSFSFYGLTLGFGGAAPAGAQLIHSFGSVGFYFDPTSFAISIAMMVISDLLSCEHEEALLSMRRGQNLCHSIGSYCSQELNLIVTKICIERTESYCCYNSRLARILNEQGRGQVGLGWGSPESPSCEGFTPQQLQALDFSQIDLSEFIAEIQPKTPDVSAIAAKNQSLINQKVQNYYGGATE